MSTLDKIICLCEVNDKTQKDLTTYLGLDKSTFSSWKSGKSVSYNKYIDKITEFFNVSVNYFYDEDDSYALSKDELDLINTYRNLTDRGDYYDFRNSLIDCLIILVLFSVLTISLANPVICKYSCGAFE